MIGNCLLALALAIVLGVVLWDASDLDLFGGARSIPGLVRDAVAALVRVIDRVV